MMKLEIKAKVNIINIFLNKDFFGVFVHPRYGAKAMIIIKGIIIGENVALYYAAPTEIFEPVIVSKMRGYNVPIRIVIVEVIKNILFKISPVSFENMKYFVSIR